MIVGNGKQLRTIVTIVQSDPPTFSLPDYDNEPAVWIDYYVELQPHHPFIGVPSSLYGWSKLMPEANAFLHHWIKSRQLPLLPNAEFLCMQRIIAPASTQEVMQTVGELVSYADMLHTSVAETVNNADQALTKVLKAPS